MQERRPDGMPLLLCYVVFSFTNPDCSVHLSDYPLIPGMRHVSRKSRRYWDGVTPSDFLNTFVKTR